MIVKNVYRTITTACNAILGLNAFVSNPFYHFAFYRIHYLSSANNVDRFEWFVNPFLIKLIKSFLTFAFTIFFKQGSS